MTCINFHIVVFRCYLAWNTSIATCLSNCTLLYAWPNAPDAPNRMKTFVFSPSISYVKSCDARDDDVRGSIHDRLGR